MALNDLQQFQQLLNNSKHILLVFGPQDNVDAAASALALSAWLEKRQQRVDIATDQFQLPTKLKFLAGADQIQNALTHTQKFIIKVDVSRAQLDSLNYDVKDGWLSIYLTPRQGAITKNELRTAQSLYKYDLIVTLGTPDKEALGGLYHNNTDLFYRTPVINVDYHPNNEHYGQVNLVDLSAASTAEIVYKIIKQLGENNLDTNLATALLTGMIAATHSFKTQNVTPSTLNLAGQLINAGADRELIIKNLYRARTLATLKLWGHALNHLQSDSSLKLVWAALTKEDFNSAGADENDLPDVIHELIANSPEAEIILLIYESNTEARLIKGVIAAEKHYDARALVRPLLAEGNKRQAAFAITGKTLFDSTEYAVQAIRKNAASIQ